MPRQVVAPLALLALLALAAVLRLRGNDYLLPLLVEPDAHIPVQVTLLEERVPEPERDVNFGKYPLLVAWTTVASTDPPAFPALDAPLAAHLERAKDPVLRVRTVVGWLSLLAVLGTWLLARELLGAGWALVPAAAIATSLLAVHFGAQARPHGAAVGFTTLTLWALVVHARRTDLRSWSLACGCLLLALGALQSSFALGFAVLAAHLAAARRAGERRWWALGGRRAGRLLLPALATALSIFAFLPFMLRDSQGVDGAQFEFKGRELEQAGHKLIFPLFNGRGFGILLDALARWEPFLLGGLALALVVLLATRPARLRRGPAVDRSGLLVVAAHALPYLVVCGMYQRVYERFLLPVLPAFAILATWGLRRLALAEARPLRLLARGLSALFLLGPLAVAWRLTEIRRAEPTQALAARWLEEHAPRDARVLVTRDLRLPLFESRVSEAEELGDAPLEPAQDRIHWSHYQLHVLGEHRPVDAWNLVWMPVAGADGKLLGRMNREPEWYVEQRYGDFLVAMLFDQGRIAPGLGKVHREFRRRGELLARFSPDGEREFSGHPLVYQDETCPGNRSFAWRVWNARRMGPVIEILKPPHTRPPGRR